MTLRAEYETRCNISFLLHLMENRHKRVEHLAASYDKKMAAVLDKWLSVCYNLGIGKDVGNDTLPLSR